jgi:hypothetical protein
MSKLIPLILLLLIQSCFAEGQVPDSHVLCHGKKVGSYALAMAKLQWTKKGEFAQGPFKIGSVAEVSQAYFQEAGYSKEKIRDIEKYSPVEVYAVNLESANQWECLYYITLNARLQQKCVVQAISFDHCAQLLK